MEKPKISVITAVYNTEKYLAECFDSMLRQTLKEWEFIVVDDGSTDGSPAICDKYAAKDSRIKVIHKANSGLSDSRHVGMDVAKADIIGFIDSDDWIEPDMFETLYNALVDSEADISTCGRYMDYVNKSKVQLPCKGTTIYNRDAALDIILEDKHIYSYVWDKLFRKEVLLERMPSMLYEDYATTFKWISHASKVVAVGKPLYHYRQRQGSILNSSNLQREIDFFSADIARYHYIVEHNLIPERHEFFRNRVLRIGLGAAKKICRSANDKDVIKGNVLKIRDMLIPYLPADSKIFKRKNRRRLRKLMENPDRFIKAMQFTGHFKFEPKHRYFSK